MGRALAASDLVAGRECEGTLTFREQFSSALTQRSLQDSWMLPFENADQIRPTTTYKGQRNFGGLWWCATNQRHVGFESWCERDRLMCLDFDLRVIGISSQPFRMQLPASLPQRSHVPDFFVRRVDGSAVVVDVRPETRIQQADQDVFDATWRLCVSVGWGYRRVGDLPNPYLANLRWLAGYRHQRCAREVESAQVLAALQAAGRVSIRDLVDKIGDPVTVLPTLFHHLWKQRIGADLVGARLHLDSLVWAVEST